jgi:hypothetical protein
MSDRLAISAALSVLMMSIFVLFGSEAQGLTYRAESFSSPVELPIAELRPSALLSIER